MSLNIRYPNITAPTEKEQIAQIRSYLHQLVDQLNYGLPTLGAGQATSESGKGMQSDSYYELRSMVVHELEQVEEALNQLMTSATSLATQSAEKISFTLDEDGNLYYEVEG